MSPSLVVARGSEVVVPAGLGRHHLQGPFAFSPCSGSRRSWSKRQGTTRRSCSSSSHPPLPVTSFFEQAPALSSTTAGMRPLNDSLTPLPAPCIAPRGCRKLLAALPRPWRSSSSSSPASAPLSAQASLLCPRSRQPSRPTRPRLPLPRPPASASSDPAPPADKPQQGSAGEGYGAQPPPSLSLEQQRQMCDPLCSVDDLSSLDYEEEAKQEKSDVIKAVVIGLALCFVAAAVNLEWVESHQDITMVSVFALGYMGIIFEESLAFNKSGVALLTAVALWVVRSICTDNVPQVVMELHAQGSEVAEIVFFLLGAMTIVEIIDAHQGFRLVTDSIRTRSPRQLLWLIGFITFFLSSILDNLTSTIVMVSLLRKLVPDPDSRRFLGAVVVIAANSGGAWTPIGDVTTTMLWINGQISSLKTMQDLFIPSVVSLGLPLALLSFDQSFSQPSFPTGSSPGAGKVSSALASEQMAPRGRLVFAVGIGSLLFVPCFKALTGLPPFLGMLLGLGSLWLLTDALHYGESDRQRLRVPQALSRIDTQGVLFFLGILLAVGSLDSAGILRHVSAFLDSNFGSAQLIAGAIGLASAVIDNVPLVAATMGMYELDKVPMDAELWQLIAYCAGTGGSILIIGSAAGVAFMGMEKVDFFWYFKKVSGVALVGYAAGMAAYLAGNYFPWVGDLSVSAAQLVQ